MIFLVSVLKDFMMLILAIMITFIIVQNGVLSEIYADEQKWRTDLLNIEDKVYPYFQFKTNPPNSNCVESWYSPMTGTSVVSLDGITLDYSEKTCGFGTISELPTINGIITESQAIFFQEIQDVDIRDDEVIEIEIYLDPELDIYLEYDDLGFDNSTTINPPTIEFDEETIIDVDDPLSSSFVSITTKTGKAPVIDEPCPTFSGKGNPGDKVHIFINMGGVFNFNQVAMLSTTVDDNGDWKITLEPPCHEDGYYDVGVSFESQDGELTHKPEFPIVIDTGSGISTEIEDEITTYSDDGDDPRDTPPPTIYGEEIDPNPTWYAYVVIGDAKLDPLIKTGWNDFAVEGILHEAIGDFENAGYTVLSDDSASYREILDTMKDERVKAFWFLGHGIYKRVLVAPSEAPLKALFLPPNKITEVIPIPAIAATDYRLYADSHWGYPVLTNTNLNQATVHACGQDRPAWHAAFAGATYDSWKYPVTPFQLVWWQLGATYPDIDPATGEEIGSSSKPGKTETPGDKDSGCLCSEEGCYLDPYLTESTTTQQSFCDKSYNFFITDENHDDNTILYSAKLNNCSIDKSTVMQEILENANMNVTMSSDAVSQTMRDPLVFDSLVSDGKVAFDFDQNYNKKSIQTGFREIVFPIYSDEPKTDKTIPSWIRNIAGWWTDGTVSDQDFVNAIKYLVDEKIIELPLQTKYLTLNGDVFNLPKTSIDSTKVKISGYVENYKPGTNVVLLIEYPDDSVDEMSFTTKSDGTFEKIFYVNKNSQIGNYDVIEKYQDIPIESISFLVNDPNLPSTGVSSNQQIPSWVKYNTQMWQSEILSDSQFLVGLQWLIEENIISVKLT